MPRNNKSRMLLTLLHLKGRGWGLRGRNGVIRALCQVELRRRGCLSGLWPQRNTTTAIPTA